MIKLLQRSLFMFLCIGSLQAQIKPQCVNGYNPITGERCANAVTSAVPFLRIVPDARGGSMGDVGIATSADPNAMHYNQSKLAFAKENVGLSATYTPWMRSLGIQDVYLAHLTGYVRLDKLQTVGFGLRYFSLGDIQFTDENGGSLGQGRPNEFELGGAYARKLSERFSTAIGAKFIYSNLASGQRVSGVDIKAGLAGAADLSFTYKAPIRMGEKKADIQIGGAISNIGSKITYTRSINREFIPTNLGLGVSNTIHLDEFNDFTFAVDFNKLLVPTPVPGDVDPQDGVADYKQVSPISGIFKSFGDAPGGFSEEMKEITLGFGMEYWYDQQFAVRTGYFYEHYSKGNRRYATVGIGIKYNIFGLNFSYLVPTTNNRNPLDNTLRFSLLFDFGALEGDALEE
jgi:Type IX secretion system protein PorV